MKPRKRDNVHFILLEKNDTNGKPERGGGIKSPGETLGMLDWDSHTRGV